MSKLTWNGTTEPVSRDQIFRRANGDRDIHFPCSANHEQDWHLTRLIHTLLQFVMIIHVDAPSPEGRSRVLREMISRTYCINSGALKGNTWDVVNTPKVYVA